MAKGKYKIPTRNLKLLDKQIKIAEFAPKKKPTWKRD